MKDIKKLANKLYGLNTDERIEEEKFAYATLRNNALIWLEEGNTVIDTEFLAWVLEGNADVSFYARKIMIDVTFNAINNGITDPYIFYLHCDTQLHRVIKEING